MPLSSRQRRELAARGQRLKAKVTIAAGELSEAAVAHVRRAFARDELLKVRINADDREQFAQTAAGLAERLPAELVQLIGRVALFYRVPPDDEESDSRAAS